MADEVTRSYSDNPSALPEVYNNTHTHTYTHTRLTAQVSQYQKGKINLDFTEAKYREWQWHQLGYASPHLAPHR